MTAQVVYQRPIKPSQQTWSTIVGEIYSWVTVAMTLVPDLGRDVRVQVLNLTETPLPLVDGHDLWALECVLVLE